MTVTTPAVELVGVALAVALGRTARRAAVTDRTRGLRSPRLLPERWARPIAGALTRADLDLTPESALRWWALGVGASVWFAIVLAPALTGPAVLGAVVAGPVALRLRSHRADLAARSALPSALDHVVAHLRAGGSVIEALAVSATRTGALQPDFRRIDARLAVGVSLDQALEQWAAERPLAGVRSAAGVLSMVTTMGGSAASALEGVVESLRHDDAASGEAQALSAQARVSAVVVGAAPVAYLVFAAATDPGSSRILVESTSGRICLIVGLALEVLAAIWMRALVGSRR
jgi:tight adherence protein B